MLKSKFSLLLILVLGLLLSNCTLSAQETLAPTLTPEPEPVASHVNDETSVPKSTENAVPAFHDPMPTAMPGAPESWQTFTDTLGRFTFEFPAGWHALAAVDPADGLLMMDAPAREEATQWVELWVALNPERASVPVWVAEKGLPWPGQVTAQEEDWINGLPVLRQRLENDDPHAGGPYVYALIWQPAGENILLWTAWPGDRPETLNLLERMVWGWRSHE